MVVSPFLDKSHGTERMVIEWISRMTDAYDIHVYSQRVADLDLSSITWHRLPSLPGPHLFNFVWWFAANRLARAWHSFRGQRCDLTFSPGVNCLDADAVSIHIVFAEFVRRVKPELRLSRHAPRSWPRLLHRRMYYRLIMFLERRVYTCPRTQLILTSPQTGEALRRHFARGENFPVVVAGLDFEVFNAARRAAIRERARQELQIKPDEFAVLVVGNDWLNKGLTTLLDALRCLPDLPLRLLVVGRDNPETFAAALSKQNVGERVRFLAPRADVEFFYAAADLYAGPSLEDTFALPAAEAMACGLPVIVSGRAGAATFVSHGVSGLVLADPTDAKELSAMIRDLYEHEELRQRMGERAAEAVRPYTWERSAKEMQAVLDEVLRCKGNSKMSKKGRRDDRMAAQE